MEKEFPKVPTSKEDDPSYIYMRAVHMRDWPAIARMRKNFPEFIRERNRRAMDKWRAANPEKVRANSRKYYLIYKSKDPEGYRAKARMYQAKRRAAIRAGISTKRVRKYRPSISIWVKLDPASEEGKAWLAEQKAWLAQHG